MRILHIGDYHFTSKAHSYEQDLMVSKMIENLKAKPKIDLVLFSGDLIFSGNDPKDFELAHNKLIRRLSDELLIPLSNIILCQGNHDTDRNKTHKSVINYFDEKINSNDLLNDEVQKDTGDFKLSLQASEGFFKYIRNNFANTLDKLNELYSISNKYFDGKKVSIVSLNSAWLSCGFRWDNSRLMLPTSILKNAITAIKDAHCKILLIHHPLSHLKEFNSIELEDLIHKEFHLMFSGHIHREQISTKFVGNNGIYANTTQATLTFDKEGEIGYSLINYNFDEGTEIIVERSTFIKKDNNFIDLSPVHVEVPCGAKKAQQNKLRKKISSKYSVELTNANQLLLEYDEDNTSNFLDLFTKPVISSNSGTDVIRVESLADFNFDNFYNSEKNYLIFGKDKCGKTSLLKRIQLYFLKHFTLTGKAPFYLDYKELEAKEHQLNIDKLIRSYYEISNADVEALINNGNLIFLIDNLNTSSGVNDVVISFLESHKNIQFIICSEFIASRVYFEELDHLEYDKLYFKDLTRKEIRLYTEKNKSIKEEEQENVLEKITAMCQQLQLPINYWTISLIILIYKKSNDDYNKNLFGILDLCVDEILQKKQLFLSKNKLSFEQYKAICSRIAYYLLIDCKEDVYAATAIDIIMHINSLFKENLRLVGDPKEIFDYLLSAGLLKEKGNKYTFRLNGIFEYFLAYYIDQHQDFKDEILNNDSIYLSFKNELEIYSGLNRQDEEFLKKIFQKTKSVFDNLLNANRRIGSLDQVLDFKLGEAYEFAEKIKRLEVGSALSHEVQDIVKDQVDPLETESEVHLKELIDSRNITSEVLERYLSILSRVFKNCDNISNISLTLEIFDYLVEAYASFGYHLIDEFADMAKINEGLSISIDENNEVFVGKELLKVLTNFIPVVTQALFFDGVGHPNFVNIILKQIEVYKNDYKNNQYKLFLLFFLLMDIDVKYTKDYIDEVFKMISLPPLKVSTYFKLNFYLAFKAYKNKGLENFFKTKVRDAKIRMDNRPIDHTHNKELSNKQKANLVRKGRNR